jgi:hypothetical protein
VRVTGGSRPALSGPVRFSAENRRFAPRLTAR